MACLLVMAALAGASVAHAEDRDSVAASLGTYMDAAVASHPRAALAAAAIDNARAEVVGAGSSLLPTLRASAAWTYNQYAAIAILPDPAGGPPEEITIVPREQLAASITARVPLLDGPSMARWRSLRNGLDAAGWDEEAVARDLRLEVARAWYAAVAAQEVAVAAERSRAAAAENLRLVQVRSAAGAATELSVQRAELEVANAEQLLIDGQRLKQVALRTLATLSGLPEPTSLPSENNGPPALPPEADALASAVASRPEIAAARERLDQFRLAKNGAWLAWTPTVAAVGTEQYTNASGFSGEDTSWAVGLQLDWELLDFGDRGADVRRARAALAIAEANLRLATDTVRDEVHAAWLDVAAAAAKVEAAQRGATVALASANEVGARFRVGTATQFDVIQAERDALDAEVRRIRAEGDAAIAGLALQRAAGQPITQ